VWCKLLLLLQCFVWRPRCCCCSNAVCDADCCCCSDAVCGASLFLLPIPSSFSIPFLFLVG
jgi:hypothetical protein